LNFTNETKLTPKSWGLGLLLVTLLGACSDITVSPNTEGVPTTAPYVVTTVLVTTSTIPPLTYTIQAGDTLGAIATQWDVTVEGIMAANGLSDATSLQVGDKIIIPLNEADDGAAAVADTESTDTTSANAYVIQAGDTLGALASTWNVTVDDIMMENGLESATSLKVGDEIIIPTPASENDKDAVETTTSATTQPE